MQVRLSTILAGMVFAVFFIQSCSSHESKAIKVPENGVGTDSLAEARKHLPENALKGLILTKGLEVKPVASEPMLKNPTNMDVDERGRVWVVEAYNYRPKANGNPVNPQGDRIVILDDIDSDGKAGKSKVFYQGPELNAPLGICVLGNRVLISQSPYVWAFYDDNGDDSADRKEVLFQGMGGEQHDHGMHSFSFGPDGKLYFSFGNEGRTLKDKNGKTVRDRDGDEIGPKKYKQGMVFRCDPDGSHVECLGNNFRNNFELAVDSYGTMWQSDNDDDGNRGVRINYVMEYGNFGYHDEMTDAAWQVSRTNMEDSVYEQHWHLNDPGVVPNLLQTGSGSPTGILVYEGGLLPGPFQNQLIHCDAGHNVVRSYTISKKNAGFTAGIVNLLHDDDDQWFRPADVAVAPDGSIMIADWYDPIVGGHGAGDQDRGRVYRVSPPNAPYTIPKFDFSTPAGAVSALQNANLAVRHHAWTSLQQMKQKAVPELEKLWRSNANPRMRARALWALSKMPSGELYISEAVKDNNPDLRITALRAARQQKQNVLGMVSLLSHDSDPQVLRECAIALRHNKSAEATKLWAQIASQYQGDDRWLLEALGIGADGQWDRFLPAYLQINSDPLLTPAGRDIIWRSRGDKSLPMLSTLALDRSTPLKSRLRYFRAFDFHRGPTRQRELLNILAAVKEDDIEINRLLLHHLDPAVVRTSKAATSALSAVLRSTYGSNEYLELVRQYKVKGEQSQLLNLVYAKYNSPEGAEALRLLLESESQSQLQRMVNTDTDSATKFLTAVGTVGYRETIDLLQQVVLSDKYPQRVRLKAAGMMGKSFGGEDRVLELLQDKQVPASLIPAMVNGLKGNIRTGMYKRALTFLSGGDQQNKSKPSPSVSSLMALSGNTKNGAQVFKTTCTLCHQVKGEGQDVGPKLGEISSKLPKEGLIKAIVNPSSAISFGYETSEINMTNGSKLTGIVKSKTAKDVELRYPGGSSQSIKISEVKSIKELKESLMPPMYESLSDQQIADVVQYLETLTKK